MPSITQKPPFVPAAADRSVRTPRASPGEIAAWSAVAGRPVADVLSCGQAGHLGDIKVDHYVMGVGARTADVVYPDGTTGTVAVTHAYKQKGARFPGEFESSRVVEKALARAAEELSKRPGFIARAGKYDSSQVLLHVAGIGQRERSWV